MKRNLAATAIVTIARVLVLTAILSVVLRHFGVSATYNGKDISLPFTVFGAAFMVVETWLAVRAVRQWWQSRDDQE